MAEGRLQQECRSRHVRAKITLPLSSGRKIALARGASFLALPLPNITNAPHRGLFRTGARRPLINCFPSLLTLPPLLRLYLTCASALLPLLHSRPRNTSPPHCAVKTSGNVTSMAEPTTPDAGPNFAPPSLPPGWCVFTSPLHTTPASPPFLLEASTACACSLSPPQLLPLCTSLSTAFARPCVRSFGLGTDLAAALEGLRSGITSKQLFASFSLI